MANAFKVSLAPNELWQQINPWSFDLRNAQFGLFNIDLGLTPHPEVEQAILDEVGSYGRQLGRIGDVVEILLRHVPLENLSDSERDAIRVLEGQLAAVRQVKRSALAKK